MDNFINLFTNEKERNNKNLWREYFVSDEFLAGQFSGDYMQQIQDFLKNQEFEQYDKLPPAFLFELISAYALEPWIAEWDGLIREDFMYQDCDEEDFAEEDCDDESVASWNRTMTDSMRIASEIWNSQDDFWRTERGSRTIRKWEYRLRGRAFQDYINVCYQYKNFGWDGVDTELFWWGAWHHIEVGPCRKADYCKTSRDVCLLSLYEYFFRTNKLPEDACVWLWKRLELSEMEGKEYAKYYVGIREALLTQHSDMRTLIGENQNEYEKYSNWKRRVNSIEEKYKYKGWLVNPMLSFRCTYTSSNPTISEEEWSALQNIIVDEVFLTHKYDDDMLEDLGRRWRTGDATWGMTKVFYESYMEDRKNNEGIPNAVKANMLIEYMKAKMNFYEKIPEYNCCEPYSYDCSTNSPEFWIYYLIMAFDGACAAADEFDWRPSFMERRMICYGQKYLSGYLKTLYRPSLEWRRRFVKADKTGRIDEPVSIEISVYSDLYDDVSESECLEPEAVIKIEFYLHHIQFYWDGEIWEGANSDEESFSFSELMQYAGKEGEEEKFVLLLALTNIDNEEYDYAYSEIHKRLEKLPIDEFCLDFVAECLAGGIRDWNDDSPNGKIETYYVENLSGYYRADLYGAGIAFTKHTSFGWRADDPDDGYYPKINEIREMALYGLNGMKGTDEVKRVMLDGMSSMEKAQQICDLLKENKRINGFYNKRYSRTKPLPKTVADFLSENDFMIHNCITLCYGNQDSCYFEQKLYTGLCPADEAVSDENAITPKEKNYKVGWLFHEWETETVKLAVNDSGAILWNESFLKVRKADSLTEVIGKHYRLDEVTAIYCTILINR